MKNKKIIRALLLTVLCCQLFLFGCGDHRDVVMLEEVTTEETNDTVQEAYEGSEIAPHTRSMIYVYVCGAVEEPGVYEVPEGSRVYEVLELAGGCIPEAASESINQARVLCDGEQLKIYTQEELTLGMASDNQMVEGATMGQAMDGKININVASADELTTLKGIGMSRALAIIAYREEQGGFKSTEEIMNISGIGEHTYDKIKEQISVR